MNAGLIISDGQYLKVWQIRALEEALKRGLNVKKIFLSKTAQRRTFFLNELVYLLVFASQRLFIPEMKKAIISPSLYINAEKVQFQYTASGKWVSLPEEIMNQMDGLDVIIKLDGSLLRVPNDLKVRHGIWSFHHGDPTVYRGRPAGFWEIMDGANAMGVMVQRISNRLDAGQVIAIAHVKVCGNSYRKTLQHAYRVGIYLLAKAIQTTSLSDNHENSPRELGSVRSIPSNKDALTCMIRMLNRLIEKSVKTLFIEKRWWIGKVDRGFCEQLIGNLSNAEVMKFEPPNRRVRFVSDVMVGYDESILSEVVTRPLYKGQIFILEDGNWSRLDLPRSRHFSYPQLVNEDSRNFILPEVSQHSSPTLFEIEKSDISVKSVIKLKGLESERLVDGTLYFEDGIWYLFGNSKSTNFETLRLWFSKDISGPYLEHPSSPISLDFRNWRMAGPILLEGEKRYRFGQNPSKGYGASINMMEILELSTSEYVEKNIGVIELKHEYGPHTLGFNRDTIYLDGYQIQYSPFAWYRKILARLP